jgi:hypothetical protein
MLAKGIFNVKETATKKGSKDSSIDSSDQPEQLNRGTIEQQIGNNYRSALASIKIKREHQET